MIVNRMYQWLVSSKSLMLQYTNVWTPVTPLAWNYFWIQNTIERSAIIAKASSAPNADNQPVMDHTCSNINCSCMNCQSSQGCVALFSIYQCRSGICGVWFLPSLLIVAVPLPAAKRLTAADVYDSKGKPRPDVLKQHFVLEGRLSDECALRILSDCSAVLRNEKTMVDIEAPVTG